jgi:hypothetical protein
LIAELREVSGEGSAVERHGLLAHRAVGRPPSSLRSSFETRGHDASILARERQLTTRSRSFPLRKRTAKPAGPLPPPIADIRHPCESQNMRCLHAILLIWASAFPAFAAHANINPPDATNEELVITAVSADPAAPSGILAMAVEISASSKGLAATYYVPFMAIGQAKPRVGQTCKVSWRWHNDSDWTTARGSVRGVRLVTKYACEGGPEASFLARPQPLLSTNADVPGDAAATTRRSAFGPETCRSATAPMSAVQHRFGVSPKRTLVQL